MKFLRFRHGDFDLCVRNAGIGWTGSRGNDDFVRTEHHLGVGNADRAGGSFVIWKQFRLCHRNWRLISGRFLKLESDVHNFMVYATTAIPVGVYDPTRLAAMGSGHWAADAGAGYTYLNEQVGFEWSAIVGFTYNFINPYTQYRSGVDVHLDWAISPVLTERLHIGAVGYVYDQLTGDSGAPPALGGFRSRVAGVGPQSGFSFQSRTGRIPQSQGLLRVQRKEPARRMDRVRHVLS